MTIFVNGGFGLLQMVVELDYVWCVRGWIVRSHISWRGGKHFLLECEKLSLVDAFFKTFRGKPRTESPNKVIFVSGGLGLLRMVSELDTVSCACEDIGPQGSGL